MESVTAFQLHLRRDKAAELRPATGEGSIKSALPDDKLEQIIYLQDFPKTKEDVKALIDVGFNRINGLNIVEEIWNREIEDETDDIDPKTDKKNREEAIRVHKENMLQSGQSQLSTKPSLPEKLFNKLYERVIVFENGVEINRILKTQPISSHARNCIT
jgi:hypothetical protein